MREQHEVEDVLAYYKEKLRGCETLRVEEIERVSEKIRSKANRPEEVANWVEYWLRHVRNLDSQIEECKKMIKTIQWFLNE